VARVAGCRGRSKRCEARRLAHILRQPYNLGMFLSTRVPAPPHSPSPPNHHAAPHHPCGPPVLQNHEGRAGRGQRRGGHRMPHRRSGLLVTRVTNAVEPRGAWGASAPRRAGRCCARTRFQHFTCALKAWEHSARTAQEAWGGGGDERLRRSACASACALVASPSRPISINQYGAHGFILKQSSTFARSHPHPICGSTGPGDSHIASRVAGGRGSPRAGEPWR
jgi:hypothetical protein